ncbi:hypothetical protein [Burkholderia gladioli]|uniref:hypothetical protein n=1 Tax=Burkholderia gladioli TaxID=28095 RepID=UPI00163EFE2C|nr:hypothetical protein [Burkholderia gladioli]
MTSAKLVPIHFPIHPVHELAGRKVYCVSIAQQRRFMAQLPGLDVPRELRALANELSKSDLNTLPRSATKYERLIGASLRQRLMAAPAA